jgi:chromosome segregation ATPase
MEEVKEPPLIVDEDEDI